MAVLSHESLVPLHSIATLSLGKDEARRLYFYQDAAKYGIETKPHRWV